MPRIGLDARMVHRTPSGLGTYAAHLARVLAALDRANTYIVIRGPESPTPIAAGPNVEEVVLPGDLDTPRNLLRGRDISRLGLDLYHSLHHFLPLALRVPRVVLTLHDLIWIEHPRLIMAGAVKSAATHVYALGAMRYAVHRADRILAVSSYSRSRAIAYYGLDPSCVHVVHHGVEHEAFQGNDRYAALASPPYFLALGNTRPYKNMRTGLQAFALCARVRPDVHLVVAGRGDSIRQLRPLARRLGIEDRVRFVGPLSHGDVVTLLHGACALVFPSLVEGFGFPVLEAMAAGCPVIASRCPAVVEVADTSALFCNPTQPEEFAAAMIRILDDPSLGADLRHRGRRRAAEFSWDRSAEGTLAVYRQLL
jgi:glycosyltransferase involved in cell wall biosynthesis